MRDHSIVKGRLRVRHFRNGLLIDDQEFDNLVVDAGLETVAAGLAGEGIDNPTHIAVGEGTTTPANSDTTLVDEIGRQEATVTRDAGEVNYFVQYGEGEASGEWTEAGLFSADTDGTMFSRVTFSQRFKGPNDIIQIDWLLRTQRD